MESAHIVRFEHGGQTGYGLLDGATVYQLSGDPFGEFSKGAAVGPVGQVRLLAPVEPSKIVAIGLNYLDHITQDAHGFKQPENPIIFLKPPSSVIGPEADIVLPTGTQQVDSEAELAVVIGRRARHVRAEDAYDYILGLTCSNDVSARDYQFKDGQWARAKGFDGSCPLGPWIETELSPSDLAIETRVNGEIRQSARTSDMAFGVAELIAHVTSFMTLLPGDVLLTGTPSGIGPMRPGDRVEVEVEDVGVLSNEAVAA